MSDGAFPDRLTQLRNRWEADPSSRVFLQLAEEYRHQGRVKEALDVLDRGLREHPGYLSALVAKGRCHLELGEPEPARVVLERVVKQDATQMVANKLLVRAYLDTGEPDRARERLDLYSLLNDSDPEIEDLRRRLRSMEQPPQAQAPEPFRMPDSPLPQAAPSGGPPPDGDIFDLGLPAPRKATADVFELEPPASAAPPAPAAPAALPAPADPEPIAAAVALPPDPTPPLPLAAVRIEADAEPADVVFPGLASRESRRRYLDSLTTGGIFLVDLGLPEEEEEPAAAAPLPEPVPVPAAPELSVAEAPVVEEATVEEEEVYVLEAIEEEPAPFQAAPSPEPVFEIEPEPVPVFAFEAPEPWSPAPEPPAAEPMFEEPLPEWAPEEVTPVAEASEPAEPVATATLGEIYLSQGHLGEAERLFREVLRREPGNAEALVGLERLAARRAERRPVSARDLLAGYEPGEEGGEAELRARKAWVLTNYLKRLRGGQLHVS